MKGKWSLFLIIILIFACVGQQEVPKEKVEKDIFPAEYMLEDFRDAQRLFETGSYNESITKIIDTIHKYPEYKDYESVKLLLMKNYFHINKFSNSLNVAERLEKIPQLPKSAYADVFAYKAYIYSAKKEITTAIDYYTKAFGFYDNITDKDTFQRNFLDLWF